MLDVFSDRPLAGNALAVVHDADPIAAETMVAVARETNLSETTFVQTADQPGADYRNRILTIGGEVPFAGHPSLGTAVAVARQRGLDRADFVQQTGTGLQPVSVSRAGDHWHASMLQDPAQFGVEPDPAPVMALAGLGGGPADPRLPPQFVSTGMVHLIAPVAERSALAEATPDLAAITAFGSPHGCDTLFLVWIACTREGETDSGHVRARMFSQLVPGGEDPGTGSAAGPLCAYLNARAGLEQIEISQGSEIGRPCSIEAQIEGDRVRVGGDVAVAVDGTVQLP